MKKTSGIALAFLLGTMTVLAEEAASESTTPENTEAKPAETSNDWKPELDKPKKSIMNDLFFGGYVRLSFGDYSVIGIEPMVGYRVSKKFSTGVKLRYDYIRDSRYAETQTSSNYGGSIFGRYRITPKFYAQLEPAMYNYELFYVNGGNITSEREWVPYLFAGGGVRQPLGGKAWVYGEIMFDLLMDDKSPYDDWTPFFSIGVGTGF